MSKPCLLLAQDPHVFSTYYATAIPRNIAVSSAAYGLKGTVCLLNVTLARAVHCISCVCLSKINGCSVPSSQTVYFILARHCQSVTKVTVVRFFCTIDIFHGGIYCCQGDLVAAGFFVVHTSMCHFRKQHAERYHPYCLRKEGGNVKSLSSKLATTCPRAQRLVLSDMLLPRQRLKQTCFNFTQQQTFIFSHLSFPKWKKKEDTEQLCLQIINQKLQHQKENKKKGKTSCLFCRINGLKTSSRLLTLDSYVSQSDVSQSVNGYW